uniref:Uncharacterized protein n=1 Tax=Leersia perrieri TaxID=77586 RepID=A0A0D9WA16_9ORYZ
MAKQKFLPIVPPEPRHHPATLSRVPSAPEDMGPHNYVYQLPSLECTNLERKESSSVPTERANERSLNWMTQMTHYSIGGSKVHGKATTKIQEEDDPCSL